MKRKKMGNNWNTECVAV